MKKELRVCSLFAGCGGFDLGFELAEHPEMKFKTIWANDIDKSCTETYRKNFPDVGFIHGDIWEYDIDEMPECDIILGGFPCQDFSMLRGDEVKRKGVTSKRGILYTKFVEAVYKKKPIVFVAENVKGLLSANNGQAIKQIIKDFKKVGYHVHWKLINFADYGVPQKRERVIIVGIRKDLDGNFKFPMPTHRDQHITVKEALKDVERIPYNNELHKMKSSTIDMIKQIPAGGNYRYIPKYADKKWMSLIYRRLHPDQPSSTIVALGGGGTWGYHYKEPRMLTNRERARIQTFPDDFIFEGTPTQIRMQLGNAVPPKGIKSIAEALLNHLYNRENDDRQLNKGAEKFLYVKDTEQRYITRIEA